MKNDTHHDNDDFDPFTSLGLQTAMLLNRLRISAQLLELASEQKEGGEEKPECENEAAEGPEQHPQYFENRLRELAARKQKGGKI
jgi:hypothetical protein